MNPVHPYLNPQENPSHALYRLLALLPQSAIPLTHNEAQLAEAICFQARRTHHIICASMAALQPVLAIVPGSSIPQHAVLADVWLLLQQEADITHAMGEIYHAVQLAFFLRHPHLPRYDNLQPAPPPMPATRSAATTPASATPDPASTAPTLSTEEAQALLAQYDRHYYFPLGKLLQQLPADISNVPRLSPEQGQMCVAVSQFAGQAMETLRSGLDALDKLLSVAREFASHASNMALPDVRGFVAYLQAEADFMQECRDDYRDAASHVLRVA